MNKNNKRVKISCNNKACPFRKPNGCFVHWGVVHIASNGECEEYLKYCLWLKEFVKNNIEIVRRIAKKFVRQGDERFGDLLSAGIERLNREGKRIYRTRHRPTIKNTSGYLYVALYRTTKGVLASEPDTTSYNDDLLHHDIKNESVVFSGETKKITVQGHDVLVNKEIANSIKGMRIKVLFCKASTKKYVWVHSAKFKNDKITLQKYVFDTAGLFVAPGEIVCFKNGDSFDCRAENLIAKKRGEWLNKSASKGYFYCKRKSGRWQLYIGRSCVGMFNAEEECLNILRDRGLINKAA